MKIVKTEKGYNQELLIIENFFSNDELDMIKNHLEHRYNHDSITKSTDSWGKALYDGTKAHWDCYNFHRQEDEEQGSLIEEKIKSIVDHDLHGNLVYHYGNKQSSLNWHNDGHRGGAVTIYMSMNWNKFWGGYLLYNMNNSEEIKCVIPEYNKAVIQVGGVMHCTTPTSTQAPIRKSVQAFLK